MVDTVISNLKKTINASRNFDIKTLYPYINEIFSDDSINLVNIFLSALEINTAKATEIVNICLNKGVNPNDKDLQLSSEFITNHYEILLNHPTNPMNPDIFLSKVSYLSIIEYDYNLQKHKPNADKIKHKGELLKIALDKGANPNNLELDSEFIANHYEILLNHPTNPINPDIFLSKLSYILTTEYDSDSKQFVPNADKIKHQGELLKIALDKGSNSNDKDLSLNPELVANHYEILLNHSTNPMSPDIFLSKVSYISTTEYDYKPNADKIKHQGELIKIALDKGANPNDKDLSLSSELIANHYEILLNHPTNPMNPDIFLSKASYISTTEYDYDSKEYKTNVDKIKQQGELLKIALDKGANPNNKDLQLDSELIANHYEILLNHPTNPMNPDIFLSKASYISTTEYDYNSKEYKPRVDKIKQQGELLKMALDKGAIINDPTLYFSHSFLYNHQDLLLNHSTNFLSINNFLEFTLKTLSYILSENNQKTYDKDAIKQKAEVIEILYIKSQNYLNFESLHTIEAQVIQELINNKIIDDLTILKLALKISTIKYQEEGKSYELENIEIQHDIIEELLSQGQTIENLSFKELNIENNNISILKLLLKSGLDPRALLIHSSDHSDFYEVLELAVSNKIQLTAFDMIVLMNSEYLEIGIVKLIFSNLNLKFNDKIKSQTIVDEYINQGPKFKEYFEEITKDIIIDSIIEDMFSKGGSLLHMLIKTDNMAIIEFILENLEYDINILNDKGQTPLFFTKSPEAIESLIKHNADLKIIDKNGNIWIHNPSIEIIEYAVENNYLPKNYAEKVALQHFSKGNYEHAAKLYKFGFDIKVDPFSEMVSSIINGLDNSIEKNKYQAILNLAHNAGIKIPKELDYLLNSHGDEHKDEEFSFIYGILHKIAKYYINLSKAELENKLGKSKELDNAYKDIDFTSLKKLYPNNLELSKIEDKFDSYYQILGKSLNLLDNDFALACLTINGLRPDPLKEDIIVFRGMKVNLKDDDKESYFKYGHRGFSTGDYQKTLGFYVDQPWNHIGGKWEYGGTYASIEAIWASVFADGITSMLQADSILMEIKFPSSSPKICGSWKYEYELIPSNINGENIIAIYNLDINSDNNGKSYQIYNATKNPYIEDNVIPKFKIGDKIKSDPLAIKKYDSLGCKDLPTLSNINKSAKYKNYTDFIEHFTDEIYASDKEQLVKDYFAGREIFIEEFNYGNIGECNLLIECCL